MSPVLGSSIAAVNRRRWSSILLRLRRAQLIAIRAARLQKVLQKADIFISATGAKDVIANSQMAQIKHPAHRRQRPVPEV